MISKSFDILGGSIDKPSGVAFRIIRGVEDFVCAKDALAVYSETPLHLLSQSYDYCSRKTRKESTVITVALRLVSRRYHALDITLHPLVVRLSSAGWHYLGQRGHIATQVGIL